MESLREHMDLVLAFTGVILTGLFFLGGLLVRSTIRHIKDRLDWKRERLDKLEERVGHLEGNERSTGERLENLSQTLEHYFLEFKEAIKQEREGRQRYEEKNDAAHGKILDGLRTVTRRPGVSNA